MGGHVVPALARHFKAGVFEGGDDVGAAPHDAVLDALHQVVPDQLARVGLLLQAGPQLRRLDVGAMAGLLRSVATRLDGGEHTRTLLARRCRGVSCSAPRSGGDGPWANWWKRYQHGQGATMTARDVTCEGE